MRAGLLLLPFAAFSRAFVSPTRQRCAHTTCRVACRAAAYMADPEDVAGRAGVMLPGGRDDSVRPTPEAGTVLVGGTPTPAANVPPVRCTTRSSAA